MGACFDTRKYKIDLSREDIEKLFSADQDESAWESGHSYSGVIGVMPSGINWTNQEFESYDDGYRWLEDNHRKWDQAMAVKIKDICYIAGGWCSS